LRSSFGGAKAEKEHASSTPVEQNSVPEIDVAMDDHRVTSGSSVDVSEVIVCQYEDRLAEQSAGP
jgi:hypothetical protein